MYYIDDYRQKAIDKIVPYLIEFPQIVKAIETSADRYQAIEDVMWKIAENFKVTNSRGIFLTANANNEVVDLIYTDKAKDAFTYGTDKPLYQAYGTGHYYSQASYISGIKKTVSEDKLIRAVMAKIIQNNTDGTIEDIIQSLKYIYNAERVHVLESDPLNLSIMLDGSDLELSSSGNYENLKKFIPACVRLNNIFVNPYQFDSFDYSTNTSYGEFRYPVRINDTIDKYEYISFSTKLESVFEEYVKLNKNKLDINEFICITGIFSDISNSNTLLSSYSDDINGFRIKLNQDLTVTLEYNGQDYVSDFIVSPEDRYTFVLGNSGASLGLWIINNIKLKGRLESDKSYIENILINTAPDIQVDDFTTVEAPIYLNCKNINNISSDYGNFIYCAVILGDLLLDTQEVNVTEYYASCYGEKQILFNCLENKNHLYINTKNPLSSNIMTRQSYYNYKDSHSSNRYVYLDGKSGIDYNIEQIDTQADINSLQIKFDCCVPVTLKNGIILSNFLGNTDDISNIAITDDGRIEIKVHYQGADSIEQVYTTYPNTITKDEYCSIIITFENNNVIILKNDEEILNTAILEPLKNIPKTIKVGYDKDNLNNYKGFIKKLSLFYNYNNLNNKIPNRKLISMPYNYNLKDISYIIDYLNNGARFITVPQLIEDDKNIDIYGNELATKRNYKE